MLEVVASSSLLFAWQCIHTLAATQETLQTGNHFYTLSLSLLSEWPVCSSRSEREAELPVELVEVWEISGLLSLLEGDWVLGWTWIAWSC